jgi:ribulose-5-phosphate 4-epimerase/fuculose-1-phosphate aldolase
MGLIDDLVTANRIASDQGLVDAYGHVSVRHDQDPNRYLMSRDRAPTLVTAADIHEFDLDSNPSPGPVQKHYLERYIHGEIYKARPDVMAVVHSHALSLILFSVVGESLQPIFHMSSFLHTGVPVFEIRDTAGMTDLLVKTPLLGAALAHTLADKRVVLMRGHGATIVGPSIKETIFRAIYTMVNAELQERARAFGGTKFLAPEEAAIKDSSRASLERAWQFWKHRAERP